MPNRHGRYPGVFALVNGLARAGRLTPQQQEFRRYGNAWYHDNLTDPGQVDPAVFDRKRHPGAAAWFKSSATHLIDNVEGYLAILDAHRIGWVRMYSNDPGEIIYDDPHQVIAEPNTDGFGRDRPRTQRNIRTVEARAHGADLPD
ncbi:hypothetical protein [Nocardia sp. NPDC052112]|uniref:hypothetical protein n=1 Tax=Nocardia sp. NPDC052112 TaxID=3155646 RepID=UPI003447C2BB